MSTFNIWNVLGGLLLVALAVFTVWLYITRKKNREVFLALFVHLLGYAVISAILLFPVLTLTKSDVWVLDGGGRVVATVDRPERLIVGTLPEGYSTMQKHGEYLYTFAMLNGSGSFITVYVRVSAAAEARSVERYFKQFGSDASTGKRVGNPPWGRIEGWYYDPPERVSVYMDVLVPDISSALEESSLDFNDPSDIAQQNALERIVIKETQSKLEEAGLTLRMVRFATF